MGVCWRLAKQLANEHAWTIRFWINQATVLQKFIPELDLNTPTQQYANITIEHWQDNADCYTTLDEVPDVVIEAFSCRLSIAQVQMMAKKIRPPVWINLEYLSAEKWVEGCHSLPSPDPATGLLKYFYFPGFSSKTGGLLREASTTQLIYAFNKKEDKQAFLSTLEVPDNRRKHLVSLFCYPHAPIDLLLKLWQHTQGGVHCLASQALPPDVLQKIKASAAAGAIGLTLLPFLPQDNFDRLLLASDINFVRGEDSFVRAQWAERPFIWQAYPQENEAQQIKLNAFLDCYLAKAPPNVSATIRALWPAWNGDGMLNNTVWNNFLRQKRKINDWNHTWSTYLQSMGDLTSKLAVFCESKL